MTIKDKYDLNDDQWNRVVGRVSDSTLLDEEKIAKLSEGQKAFLYSAGAGLASAGIAYAVPAAIEAVREARIRNNRDKYIGQMKKVHPELKNMNKDDLHIAYNSIAASTPNVLKDPLLGGQTLKQFAQYRRADVTTLNEISRLQNNRPMDQAMLNATNFLAQGVGKGVEAIKLEKDRLDEFRYREALDDKKFKLEEYRVKTVEDRKMQAQENALSYKKTRDKELDQRYEDEAEERKRRYVIQDQQQRADRRSRERMHRENLKMQKDQYHSKGFYSQMQEERAEAREKREQTLFDERNRRQIAEDAYRKDRDAIADARYQIAQHINLENRRKDLGDQYAYENQEARLRRAIDTLDDKT